MLLLPIRRTSAVFFIALMLAPSLQEIVTHSLLCSKSAIYPNYIKIIRNRISSSLRFTLIFNNPEIPDNSIFYTYPSPTPFFQNILHPFTIPLNPLIHNTLKGEGYPSPFTITPSPDLQFTKTRRKSFTTPSPCPSNGILSQKRQFFCPDRIGDFPKSKLYF